MLIDVEHRMHFEYDDFVRQSQMEIRVEPQVRAEQTLHSFQLAVGPDASVERYVDWNDNWVHHLAIRDYHNRIEIVARSLVDTLSSFRLLDSATSRPSSDLPGDVLDFCRFTGPVGRDPELEALIGTLRLDRDAPTGAQVMAIGEIVSGRIDYQPGVTSWRSTVGDVLKQGSGVCQDFAHLSLALIRSRGIPCRYVSGYLHVGELPAQSHAWIEFYDAADGWFSFDPTNGLVPNENYVVVGVGRSYEDVPPNRGVYRGGAEETLEAVVSTQLVDSVDVVRLREQIEGLDVPVYAELPSRTGTAKLEADRHHGRATGQGQQQQ